MITFAQNSVIALSETNQAVNQFSDDMIVGTSTSNQSRMQSASTTIISDSVATTTLKTVKKIPIISSHSTKKMVMTTESCSIPVGTLLQKGVKDGKSKHVTKLQNSLYKLGYLKSLPNGFFGSGTYEGIRIFQKEYGYRVTGIVGPYSLAKINELSCGVSTSIDEPNTSGTLVKNTVNSKTVPVTIMQADISDNIETNTNSLDRPIIVSFSLTPTTAGDQIYDAKIINADSVSMKATCSTGIIEVKNLVGLTKVKIADGDSVCRNEKFLFLNDVNQALIFERKKSQLVFTDREGQPSWFSFDASSTPTTNQVPYTIKACLKNICVQRVQTAKVSDYFQKIASTELSLSGVKLDSSKKLFLNAYNVNTVTVKAGCPYNTQSVDDAGKVLSDEAGPCNIEKSILSSPTTLVASFEKGEGIPISSFGFNFEMKSINGQIDPSSNIELAVKACRGVQSDTISSTTLRCIEKSVYLPVYPRQASSTSTK